LNGISCICYKVENNHIWPTYKFRTSITNTKMFVEQRRRYKSCYVDKYDSAQQNIVTFSSVAAF